MPSELLSEQLVILLLIIAGGFIISATTAPFKTMLDEQAWVIGQQKLSYFYDLVGYSALERINTYAEAPTGTLWIAASGTTLTMNVNGTVYVERYPFQVSSPNLTNPACLEISYTATGVAITGVQGVDCSWPAS